jgi:hypothetical protein
MIVTFQLFKAYLECPTKCWLLSRGEPSNRWLPLQWLWLQPGTRSVSRLVSWMEAGAHRVLPAPQCWLAWLRPCRCPQPDEDHLTTRSLGPLVEPKPQRSNQLLGQPL